MMKWAALSAPSASSEPASTFGWLATTATGCPPRRARAQITDRPKPRLHLEAGALGRRRRRGRRACRRPGGRWPG